MLVLAGTSGKTSLYKEVFSNYSNVPNPAVLVLGVSFTDAVEFVVSAETDKPNHVLNIIW